MVYSTYLGNGSWGQAIAVDQSGSAYVTGSTISPTFPTTPGAFQTRFGGGRPEITGDAFVTKFNKTGTELLYSSFLGGSRAEGGRGIAVDNSGNAFVTGSTESDNFPTKDAIQPSFAGGSQTNAFVTVLNATGSRLIFSTFLGGSGGHPPASLFAGGDVGNGIAVDSSGNILVTGITLSSDFPITKLAEDGSLNGPSDVFVTKITLHDAPALPADFTLAAASPTATVARGQSATYTLSVTLNGFNTAVSLACSGLPAGATCSFTPNPLTPAGSAATSTLTISTTAASAGILPPAFKPITPIYALWLPFSALGLLGLVVLPQRKPTRKSWLPSKEAALFLVVLFALVLGIACGGSSRTPSGGTGGNTTGTPVGTYTVVVSGASGSLQKTTSLTLTVQ